MLHTSIELGFELGSAYSQPLCTPSGSVPHASLSPYLYLSVLSLLGLKPLAPEAFFFLLLPVPLVPGPLPPTHQPSQRYRLPDKKWRGWWISMVTSA